MPFLRERGGKLVFDYSGSKVQPEFNNTPVNLINFPTVHSYEKGNLTCWCFIV